MGEDESRDHNRGVLIRKRRSTITAEVPFEKWIKIEGGNGRSRLGSPRKGNEIVEGGVLDLVTLFADYTESLRFAHPNTHIKMMEN